MSIDVKRLREKLELSQQELADLTGLPKGRINAWEQRNTGPTKMEDSKIIQDFIDRNGVNLDENKSDQIENRRKRKLSSGPFMVPFVPVKAQAGYAKALDQITYTTDLEKYSLPPGIDHRGAEWMYWEVEGDSMLPTFRSKDILLASLVPAIDWPDIKNYYVYVLVFADYVAVKRIFKKSSDKWVLISDNEKEYPQKLINISDVTQLWVYRRTWHTAAAPPKKFEIRF